MTVSPKVFRYFFYGLMAAGGLSLCGLLALNSFESAADRTGLNSLWLVGLCCVIPFVLAGIALANESR
jgi:hypothetical protein